MFPAYAGIEIDAAVDVEGLVQCFPRMRELKEWMPGKSEDSRMFPAYAGIENEMDLAMDGTLLCFPRMRELKYIKNRVLVDEADVSRVCGN